MSDVHVSTGEGEVMDLAHALLVYRGKKNVFVTQHDIFRREEEYMFGPGSAITQESAARLLEDLGRSLSYKGFLPLELLAIAPGAMAWWRPPCKRTVWFECGGGENDDAIGTRHGLASHPALVFAAVGGKWYVFAVKTQGRPGPDTPLYRAPYFNVWESGEICTGNVRLPATTSATAIEAYERAFFESRFTHPNNGFKVRFKGGGHALWKALLDAKGAAPFPARVLVPSGLTLAQLVRRLMENRPNER